MKKFNVYYKSQKINQRPISQKDKDIILEKKFIFKDNGQGYKEKILVKDIKFIKCTVL
jgi:hypothetical protein